MAEGGIHGFPVVDVRVGGPVKQAEQSAARARALRDDCLTFFPSATSHLLPLLDRMYKEYEEGDAPPEG